MDLRWALDEIDVRSHDDDKGRLLVKKSFGWDACQPCKRCVISASGGGGMDKGW